jgi:DNA replication protein DnaC
MNTTDKKLKSYLKHLRMPTVAQMYDDLAESAISNQMSYQDYLLELIERECETRRHNRISTLTRESKLPAAYTPESFDMKRLPPKIVHRAKALMEGSFVDRCENVLAFGNPGSGKSHLVCAIGYELIRQGKRSSSRIAHCWWKSCFNPKKNLYSGNI